LKKGRSLGGVFWYDLKFGAQTGTTDQQEMKVYQKDMKKNVKDPFFELVGEC
jgi:hypothetical protein